MCYNKDIEIAVHDVPTSNGCMSLEETHPMKYTPEQRIKAFWNKVAITADDNQCWLWLGGCDSSGYGTKNWDGKTISTHRLSWILNHGNIPNGLSVLHTCDNRKCVNPSHLFLGTHQDNMKDMKSKNRQNHGVVYGELHGNHNLTDAQVEEIRARYKSGNVSQAQLAREYSSSTTNIHTIVHYRSRNEGTKCNSMKH